MTAGESVCGMSVDDQTATVGATGTSGVDGASSLGTVTGVETILPTLLLLLCIPHARPNTPNDHLSLLCTRPLAPSPASQPALSPVFSSAPNSGPSRLHVLSWTVPVEVVFDGAGSRTCASRLPFARIPFTNSVDILMLIAFSSTSTNVSNIKHALSNTVSTLSAHALLPLVSAIQRPIQFHPFQQPICHTENHGDSYARCQRQCSVSIWTMFRDCG
ncbi:hypothetical protein M422DRAFT_243828 [Sphaerobolus stellatus SS14]|nr:hypothetical protein M422DRAFT_243828 [Sphaerobolus stellatus SS14]